ncbi:MAG: hypothetical protein COA88_03055 [Kordia sp.]|nr:MAG: hypothetical protein COA88_03055 [Kordia sp.]
MNCEINLYDNVKNPDVKDKIYIEDILDKIKNPDENTKDEIKSARFILKKLGKEQYDKVKKTLPCCTFNFLFNKRKTNKNLKEATGLIYLDLDYNTEIDINNDYIYASWLSLSKTGRGILVKVDGLTLDNFKDTYNFIAGLLNVDADDNARKATQFTILSYDPDIHINNDSTIVSAVEDIILEKKVHNTYTIRKEKEYVVDEMCNNFNDIKYNNFNDIDFKGKDYIIFEDEKVLFSELYIPKKIDIGERNTKLTSIAHQLKALNPSITKEAFKKFVFGVNSSRCAVPLSKEEIERIVENKYNIENIELISNKPRRVVFNQDSGISTSDKRKVTARCSGDIKIKNSNTKIEKALNIWNLKKHGKATKISISKLSGVSRNIVGKRIEQFKKQVNYLKIQYLFLEIERKIVLDLYRENYNLTRAKKPFFLSAYKNKKLEDLLLIEMIENNFFKEAS